MPHMAYATYPGKTDVVLIGWDNLARNKPVYLRNYLDAFELDSVSALKDGGDPSNPDHYIYTLGVLGVTPRLQTILLVQFTGPTAHDQRETWMNTNARTWLS